jgi:mono/diheme cytochrome c family protein
MRGVLLFVAGILSAIVIPTAQAADAAQTPTSPSGTVDAGRAVWAMGNTSCRNCHGGEGEGAFALALAGRKLTFERFRDYVRSPKGRMPGYVASELTDQEIADLVAYFDSLPPAANRVPGAPSCRPARRAARSSRSPGSAAASVTARRSRRRATAQPK